MSLVHILPLHLVQVGWGSRSSLARKAPHFLAPTPGQILNSFDIIANKEKERKENTHPQEKVFQSTSTKRKQCLADDSSRSPQEQRGLTTPVVEQRMTAEPRCWGGGGGVSHPSQLTTGLVIKSVTTSPTLAGERMLFILQVSILSEQMDDYGPR